MKSCVFSTSCGFFNKLAICHPKCCFSIKSKSLGNFPQLVFFFNKLCVFSISCVFSYHNLCFLTYGSKPLFTIYVDPQVVFCFQQLLVFFNKLCFILPQVVFSVTTSCIFFSTSCVILPEVVFFST